MRLMKSRARKFGAQAVMNNVLVTVSAANVVHMM